MNSIPLNLNKHAYDGLTRQKIGRKWCYGEDLYPLPAVTRILNETAPPEKQQILDDWRKRVGEEEADRISAQSADIGNAMHENLERWLLHNAPPEGQYFVKLLTELMQKEISKHCSEVWACEVPLYFPKLYGGICDLTGIWKNKPSIIDFKNSRKPKKLEWIEDYKWQCGAYGLAHNELFPETKIEQAVVIIACWEPAQVQVFEFTDGVYKECEDGWLVRLNEYYAQLQQE